MDIVNECAVELECGDRGGHFVEEIAFDGDIVQTQRVGVARYLLK